jgi:hypothetical protein
VSRKVGERLRVFHDRKFKLRRDEHERLQAAFAEWLQLR